jgi:hypothetical protein
VALGGQVQELENAYNMLLARQTGPGIVNSFDRQLAIEYADTLYEIYEFIRNFCIDDPGAVGLSSISLQLANSIYRTLGMQSRG